MKIFEEHIDEETIIKYLELQEDEIFNVEDEEGNSWLHFYPGKKYSNLHNFILEAYPAIVHAENDSMETPIFSAINHNNLDLVKKIIAIDESVLTHTDINGRSPLFVSFSSRWCSVQICEFLWNLVPLQGNFLWIYKNALEVSFEKSKFLLDNTIGVFDMIFDNRENILHKTINVRSPYTKRIIKYIYEKSGSILFSAEDAHGMIALHHAYGDLLKLIYGLYPEGIYHQNRWGNTPLVYAQNTGCNLVNWDAMEIMKKYPEILKIKNNKKQIMFMNNDLCSPELFHINPASFNTCDKYGDTPLHLICLKKRASWWELVDEVLQIYPKMMFQKNNEGNTPLDIGISNKGYSSQQRSKERFIAVCLKYSKLPEKYWIFKGVSFDLVRSMGHLMDRSTAEATKAMTFLPMTDKEIIRTLIIGMNRLESKIMTNIISMIYQPIWRSI